MGAIRAWVVGLGGLFGTWILLTVLGSLMGTVSEVGSIINTTGVADPVWMDFNQKMNGYFTSLWTWAGFLIFASFIIYIVLESMRRRPEEYY